MIKNSNQKQLILCMEVSWYLTNIIYNYYYFIFFLNFHHVYLYLKRKIINYLLELVNIFKIIILQSSHLFVNISRVDFVWVELENE